MHQLKPIDNWLQQVAEAFARYENVPVRQVFRFRPGKHGYLFMTWKSWSLRYAVNVEFIIRTLLDYYGRIRRPSGSCITFGVHVNQLVGPRAQQLVEQAVIAAYPAGENYAAVQSDIRSKILTRRLQKFPPDQSLVASLQQYRRTLQEQQERNNTLPSKFKRAWRGNPFH